MLRNSPRAGHEKEDASDDDIISIPFDITAVAYLYRLDYL